MNVIKLFEKDHEAVARRLAAHGEAKDAERDADKEIFYLATHHRAPSARRRSRKAS